MTDPKDLSYKLTRRENIAETAELRVRILTLGEDEKVPWHDHSEITDTFICLEGTVVVETRAPRARHELVQGDRLAVPQPPMNRLVRRRPGALSLPRRRRSPRPGKKTRCFGNKPAASPLFRATSNSFPDARR